LLLDEPARLLHGPRRTVSVVHGDQRDLAAIDAAFRIHLIEIRRLSASDSAIGGRWAAVGHGLPDPDLAIGDARIVSRGRQGHGTESDRGDERRRDAGCRWRAQAHYVSPPMVPASNVITRALRRSGDHSSDGLRAPPGLLWPTGPTRRS